MNVFVISVICGKAFAFPITAMTRDDGDSGDSGDHMFDPRSSA